MKRLNTKALITIVICIHMFIPYLLEAQDGLMGYWSFDSIETHTITDHSEFNNDATIFGANQSQGIMGNALYFDGVDDYVLFGDDQDQPPEILRDLGEGSISVWFRVDSIPVENGIAPILYYGSEEKCNFFDAANQGLIIEVGHSPVHHRSERLYFTMWKHGCTVPSFCYDSNDPIVIGEWYHFVAIVGRNYNTGYLNGEEITHRRYNFGNNAYSQFFEDAIKHERMWLGRGHWDRTVQHFQGAIDELRIYDRPLSKQEVKLLYGDSTGVATTIGNEANYDPGVKIFPNPASELVHYDLRETDMDLEGLEITDLSGKVVYSKYEELLNYGTIPTRELNPGIYHMVFIAENARIKRKLLIN